MRYTIESTSPSCLHIYWCNRVENKAQLELRQPSAWRHTKRQLLQCFNYKVVFRFKIGVFVCSACAWEWALCSVGDCFFMSLSCCVCVFYVRPGFILAREFVPRCLQTAIVVFWETIYVWKLWGWSENWRNYNVVLSLFNYCRSVERWNWNKMLQFGVPNGWFKQQNSTMWLNCFRMARWIGSSHMLFVLKQWFGMVMFKM